MFKGGRRIERQKKKNVAPIRCLHNFMVNFSSWYLITDGDVSSFGTYSICLFVIDYSRRAKRVNEVKWEKNCF